MSERGQPGWVPEDDPVIALLLSGESMTLHEAEERYLDQSIPLVLELLRGPMGDEELGQHPLMRMLVAHGSRGREDTL